MHNNIFSIPDELKKLPSKPGVYIMKDENSQVIYVGKAVNLRSRVRSYFRESGALDPKVRSMVSKIIQFEYIVTDNEVEAIILECNLIKQHTPKYNIRLKDSKAYPYIKLTDYESLPRIIYTRQREQKKGRYFGPYPSSDRVREILRLVHDIWPLRRCHRRFPRDFGKGRPCLQHHIGHCKAPCHQLVTEEEYRQMIEEAVAFIQGKVAPVVAKLNREMAVCAEALAFEKAAELRDLLNAVTMLTEKQIAENANINDRDVIALARKEGEALMQIFFVRDGKMTGREHFMMQIQDMDKDLPDGDIFAAFIKQFYGEAAFIPKELVLAQEPTDREAIIAWLAQLKEQKVRITVPQKGEKHQLIQLAARNATLTMEQFGAHLKQETTRNQLAIQEIADALQLSEPPARIEAYDISNIQGFESVGSMVVFEEGKSKNSDYRKFKIKGVHGPDDYASMEEVITRRFKRYLSEQEELDGQREGKFSKLPDLLMIDGGKGQVHAAEEVLLQMGIFIPVCGMVKDDRHRTRGLMYRDVEISMPRSSEGFRLITRIQDEVHRFALEYHRKLRADSQVRSILDDIPGIGPTRRKALMRHFKGIDPIRQATVEALAQVDAMNQKAAEAVFGFFHKG